ncbi:MAG TPA: polysaccharide biosynthesis protein [Bacteroidales bacterium]|nr:polysaccharide biosynthesis protein [Bacteroidales bacterium]
MFKNYPDIREALRSKTSEFFHKYSVPRWMLLIHDTIAVFVTFIIAYLLRYNLIPDNFQINQAIIHGLIALFVYTVFMLTFRSYAGLIRHTTLTDVTLVFVSTTVSAVVLVLISYGEQFFNLSEDLVIPVAILLIHYVLITVFLFFMRISVKMLFRFATHSSKSSTNRVIIYGAGEMGFIVKRVLLSDPRGGFAVAGFIDDNKQLQGKKINGIQVFDSEVLSSGFIIRHKIQTLILAIRNLPSSKKSEIIKKAIDFGVEVLETPAIEKWLNGQLEVKQLQKVQLEDLLGRDPIRLDLDIIRKGLAKKTILVTGAAGSIGSEIVRQLSRFSTHNIILIDQAETPMFHLENELRKSYTHVKFKSQLADVTNPDKMELIFQKYHPEIVFHAAAYKHVPLMEENPHEALRVNVGGTRVMIELSVKYDVKKFVMISSDKSVNPTNIMGASKRVCEMLVQTKAMKEGVKTQFVITRFGNVLGSNGSVIPLFKKQIEEGGPVTVTHPDIMRYFMTIPEACQLVLEAGFMGKGGEIFVFDMGKPVKIADLAINMIRLSGLEPEKDIKIEYTGLRQGEKLFEELLSNTEEIIPTHHEKIKVAKVDKNDYKTEVLKVIASLKNIYGLSEQDVFEFFEMLVPEYKSSKANSNGNFLSKKKSVLKEN